MTLHENAKFTCERLVQEYIENGSFKGDNDFWETLAIIKHSFELGAINRGTAERYCHHLHVSFDEMMTA